MIIYSPKNWKDKISYEEYLSAPPLLKQLIEDFFALSLSLHIDPVVTRIKGKIEGDSGVHAAHRAVDFRYQFLGSFLYSTYQRDIILNSLNLKYPRKDKKLTAICHSFRGGPKHFHLQIPPQ